MSETTTPTAAPVADKGNLLEVTGLSKRFPLKHTVFDAMLRKERQYLTAVDNVSLTLAQGETLGLVGESGCGKSTLARTIINLYRPTERQGRASRAPTSRRSSKEELRARPHRHPDDLPGPLLLAQPAHDRAPDICARPLLHHNILSGKDEVDAQMQRLLDARGPLRASMRRPPTRSAVLRRPAPAHRHRPRPGGPTPRFIVADEPVSALDVSIQAQVINLLIELTGASSA